MDAQALSTIFAWALTIVLGFISWLLIRGKRDIDWHASAVFALGGLFLGIAAAVSATLVLTGGSNLSEEARWTIIICRAISAAFFLGVLMDLTGRPRWVGRLLELITRPRS